MCPATAWPPVRTLALATRSGLAVGEWKNLKICTICPTERKREEREIRVLAVFREIVRENLLKTSPKSLHKNDIFRYFP